MKLFITVMFLLTNLISFDPTPIGCTVIKWVADGRGKKIKKEDEKKYNSRGDVIKWTQYLDNGPICLVFDYEYSQGNLVKKSEKFCDGKITTVTIYQYDKAGRVVSWVDRDIRDNRDSKHVNTYVRASKNISYVEDFDENGKEYSKTIFEYYPGNLLKKEIQYSAGSWFSTIDYRYDANQHLIYEDAEADGGVGIVKYYYIYQNNVLTKDSVEVPGSATEYHIYEIVKN